MVRRIFILLLITFIVIQFIRPDKNISIKNSPNDIIAHYVVPDTVQQLLKVSCYDCHSNNTIYPWYSNIQPFAWWLQHHVNDGKKHLNFSEFMSYSGKRQFKKLDEVVDQVKEKEMPISSYLWIHTDSRLNEDQRKMIMDWAAAARDKVKADSNVVIDPEEKEVHSH